MARGAFKRRHPIEYEQACAAAMLDHGMSAPEAHRAMCAGELPGIGSDLAAYSGAPVATVAQWGTQARRRRRAEEIARSDPAEVLGETIGVLVSIHRAELDRVRLAASRPGANSEKIAGRLGALAKAGREIAALARVVQAPASREPDKAPAQDGGQGGDDFLARLAGRR